MRAAGLQSDSLLWFPCSLSDHELFTNLDSGFNSVDSGSKRWSGNEVKFWTDSVAQKKGKEDF